ncbi:hypothetical protein [Prosthecodimorpha staleyi]|uniref:Uncharacterized protein n=1 Tax=Prosthecodimorpha staleyi TaxID=2840188 RepID=A0A947DCQ0_9HYPH|nr:hypothetical protein [Prosthecodimorpha staleyi]MBT9292484.1 hypothetical protein [Prosthecodimorpha staleyi]
MRRSGSISNELRLPVHPWSVPEFIPGFESSDGRAGTAHALAIGNSKEDGGSLTPQSHIGQIYEFLICTSLARDTSDLRVFVFATERKTDDRQPER